jgi:membrane protease YdiL (CAAX protease family)
VAVLGFKDRAMGYLGAARHPWCSFLFLLPLIVVYEGGVFWLAADAPDEIRNGADVWLRKALESYGVRPVLAAPGLVLGLLLMWSFLRWADKPPRAIIVVLGMALESLLLGAILQSISLNFPEILQRTGLDFPLAIDLNLTQDRLAKIVTFVGAGIYEETLFRFLLFGIGGLILRLAFVPGLFAIPLAAILSSLLFALAHHIPPGGEPFDPTQAKDRYIFLLRTAQGLFFCLIYWLRGFGIAVGAHAAYDIIVGVKWT